MRLAAAVTLLIFALLSASVSGNGTVQPPTSEIGNSAY